MVNDIILVTKRVIDPGTITPPSSSLLLAATFMSFGHPALWILEKKLCKCFIFDFYPFLTAFFKILRYFLLIYTNRTISPLPTERCGLRFEAATRM